VTERVTATEKNPEKTPETTPETTPEKSRVMIAMRRAKTGKRK
jgi:hypothetical protein